MEISEEILRPERHSLSALCGGKAARSQNHPPVAFPPRHSLTIEILEQRNRILSRNAGKFFERRHVDGSIRTPFCMLAQLLRQTVERAAMEVHLAGHAHQHARINQQLQNLSAVLLRRCANTRLRK